MSVGYPMAKNLRNKTPATDSLLIYDINVDAAEKFLDEVRNETRSVDTSRRELDIGIATSPRVLAEESVRSPVSFQSIAFQFVQ